MSDMEMNGHGEATAGTEPKVVREWIRLTKIDREEMAEISEAYRTMPQWALERIDATHSVMADLCCQIFEERPDDIRIGSLLLTTISRWMQFRMLAFQCPFAIRWLRDQTEFDAVLRPRLARLIAKEVG